VRLDGEVLAVDGVAPDTAVATQVKTAVTRNLPSGYRGQADLEIKSDAMIWSEQEARRKSAAAAAAKKAEEDKARAEEARRALALAEVQRRAAEEAARARAEAEARRRAEEDAARRRAEAEARLREDQERIVSEEASFLKLLEDERRREAEAAAQREAEARRRAAEEEARRQAEAEARRRAAEEEARRQAEAETRRLAEVCRRELNEAVNRGEIRFESGSDELRGESTATLDALIGIYRKCPGARIEIGGHTDSTGKADDNLDLSLRRAEAVLDYFVAKGLPRENFIARGYGETRPLASNRSPGERARNRRIEFGIAEP
jgi:outer membrane protein OmpA-like peptidoglycan-associated protein